MSVEIKQVLYIYIYIYIYTGTGRYLISNIEALELSIEHFLCSCYYGESEHKLFIQEHTNTW